MAPFHGCDTVQLAAYGDQLGSAAQVMSRTTELVGIMSARTDVWVGPDAEAFRHELASVLLPSLSSIEDRIRSLSAEALEHAQEQDQVSTPGVLALGDLDVEQFFSTPYTRPETIPRAGREGGREDDRRGTGSEGDTGIEPKGEGLPGGLGEPVPGTSVEDPGMASWSPTDPGAGEWGAEEATLGDQANHEAVTQAASAMALLWPDASENLLHFLSNTGEDKEMDLEPFLEGEPHIEESIARDEDRLGADAIRLAQESGAEGPLTYPVQTGWTGVEAESDNWYYATGSGDYSIHGHVTVYPPDADNPEWRYEMDTTLEYRDQYNWDGGKATAIDLPLVPDSADPVITDERLAELHEAGLAREYLLHGSMDRTRSGP